MMKKILLILSGLMLVVSVAFCATTSGLSGMVVLPDANVMSEGDIHATASYVDYEYGTEIIPAVSYGVTESMEVALSGVIGDYDSYTLATKYQIPLDIPAKVAVGAHITQNPVNDMIYGAFAVVTLPVFEPIYETGAPGLNVSMGLQYASEPLLPVVANYKKDYIHFFAGSTLTYGPLELAIDGRLKLNNADWRDGFSAKVSYTLPVYGVQLFAGVNNSNLYNTASKLGWQFGASYTF